MKGIFVVFIADLLPLNAETTLKGLTNGKDAVIAFRPLDGCAETVEKTIAEFEAFLKMLWDGFFGDLLPGNVNQEFLKSLGIRKPFAKLLKVFVSLFGRRPLV